MRSDCCFVGFQKVVWGHFRCERRHDRALALVREKVGWERASRNRLGGCVRVIRVSE